MNFLSLVYRCTPVSSSLWDTVLFYIVNIVQLLFWITFPVTVLNSSMNLFFFFIWQLVCSCISSVSVKLIFKYVLFLKMFLTFHNPFYKSFQYSCPILFYPHLPLLYLFCDYFQVFHFSCILSYEFSLNRPLFLLFVNILA